MIHFVSSVASTCLLGHYQRANHENHMDSMNQAQNFFRALCDRNPSLVLHALILDHSQCGQNHKHVHCAQNVHQNGYHDLRDPHNALDFPIGFQVGPKSGAPLHCKAHFYQNFLVTNNAGSTLELRPNIHSDDLVDSC